MANAQVKEFTDANFDSEVLSSSQPVLVDFWAEWCMPCRSLGPIIDAIATEQAGKVKVGKVDIDSNREISMKYGITAIPTIMIFKDGKPVRTFVGLHKKEGLVAALEQAV
ncbi:MAG: thioredoxin [Phycisphaerales bacterium]